MTNTENWNEVVSVIRENIASFKKAGKEIFLSSSFQSHSIPLLHIISNIDCSIPIYFLDTGFHFPETILFKNKIRDLLKIETISLKSPLPKTAQLNHEGQFYFCSNTDYCCHINKVLPLQPILIEKDIWITGVRRDQTRNRSQMGEIMNGPFGSQRYHPMLNWNSKMIWDYRKEFDLPSHPLEKEGYQSVGCIPCTSNFQDDERRGRWFGQKKEECGLHTTLLDK